MRFTRGLAGVLVLAVLGAGCARLDPRVSAEYKSQATLTYETLAYWDQAVELQKEQGDSDISTERARTVAESRRALNAATRAQKTWGDRRVHKLLLAYAGALGDEGIVIFGAGEEFRKPWKPELAARLAELEAAKKEARQNVEAALR